MAEDKTFKLSPQHVLWNRVVAAVMPRGVVRDMGDGIRKMSRDLEITKGVCSVVSSSY